MKENVKLLFDSSSDGRGGPGFNSPCALTHVSCFASFMHNSIDGVKVHFFLNN